jgi:dolichol-phosphate mannosyltransferase
MNSERKAITLSVVIPTYNEKDNISATIEEILHVIDCIADIDKFQVIVVDDHSSDDTYGIISQLNDTKIVCLRLSRRSGSFTALRAGIAEAKGEIMLCISGDGQDDPSCLKYMMKKWRNGANVVWALRKNRDNERPHIRIPAQLFYRLLKWLVSDKDSLIDLSRADFCLLDSHVIDAVNDCQEKNTSLFGLIAWLGFNQDFVEYERRERRYGRSKWNFRTRLGFAKDWIVAFSGLPLKVISIVGFIVACAGFLYAIFIGFYVIFRAMPINGWPSLMVIILVLGGLQMIMVGIVGEYLWRNLDESRKRPLFFYEKRSDKDKKPNLFQN